MRFLGWVAAFSVAATLVVAGGGLAAKVRIDSRAHFLAAESLAGDDWEGASTANLAAAGASYARSVRSYVPFDPTPGAAAQRLAELCAALAARGEGEAAVALLDDVVSGLERDSLLFRPLAAERLALSVRRAEIREMVGSDE